MQRALMVFFRFTQNLPTTGKLQKKSWYQKPVPEGRIVCVIPLQCSNKTNVLRRWLWNCLLLYFVGFSLCNNYRVISFLGTRLFYNKGKEPPIILASKEKNTSKCSKNITKHPETNLVFTHMIDMCTLLHNTVFLTQNCFFQLQLTWFCVAGSEASKPWRNFTLQTAASRGLSSEGIILQNDGCAYLFALWLPRQVCHISSNY